MPDDAATRLPSPALEGRVPVRPEELERAIAVWLMVMPRHLWAPFEKMLTIDRRRLNAEDRVEPRDVLAAWIARKFVEAKWEASYIEPVHPGSPPAWRGD